MARGVLCVARGWLLSAITRSTRSKAMLDLLFVMILLFASISSLAYVSGCERL
jgi:hypothetical protein